MIYTPDTTVSYLRNKFSALRLETCPPVAQGWNLYMSIAQAAQLLQQSRRGGSSNSLITETDVCGCAMTCDMEDGLY